MSSIIQQAPDTCTRYLEGNLGQENEFVSLEESPRGVRIDRVGDLICQVDHPLLDVVIGGRALNGFLKDPVECLRKSGAGSSAPGLLAVL